MGDRNVVIVRSPSWTSVMLMLLKVSGVSPLSVIHFFPVMGQRGRDFHIVIFNYDRVDFIHTGDLQLMMVSLVDTLMNAHADTCQVSLIDVTRLSAISPKL